MISELTKINNKISKFVHEYLLDDNYQLHIERISHFRSFVDILLNNMPFIDETEYKTKVTKEDSIKYAYLFLESISKEYGLYLFDKLDKDEINFITFDEAMKKDFPLTSYTENINDKCIINIVLYEDISDTYSIIHELLHSMNAINDISNPNLKPETRDYFTELVSFLGTTLAQDFFTRKYPNNKEFRYDIHDNYYGLYKKAMGMDYILGLVDAYIFNEIITNHDIEKIEKDKSSFYLDSVLDYLEEILEYDDEELGVDCLDLLYKEGYIIAGLLTNYILNNYQNYEERVEVLKDLNELIMTKDYKVIFNYLDLDVIEKDNWFINLTDDSLNKIEKSFKEESKKI